MGSSVAAIARAPLGSTHSHTIPHRLHDADALVSKKEGELFLAQAREVATLAGFLE